MQGSNVADHRDNVVMLRHQRQDSQKERDQKSKVDYISINKLSVQISNLHKVFGICVGVVLVYDMLNALRFDSLRECRNYCLVECPVMSVVEDMLFSEGLSWCSID